MGQMGLYGVEGTVDCTIRCHQPDYDDGRQAVKRCLLAPVCDGAAVLQLCCRNRASEALCRIAPGNVNGVGVV
jgi:hypothetical protein